MTKTKPKKLLSLLFGSLVVIGVVALIFKLTSKPVSAAWYDDSWQYRTKIVITNTGSAVTNQKVKFDIATDSLITAGKIQSDCGDSRFVSSTGEILRYYLDAAGGACNTASTDYYVLIPSINVGSVVLYHYYGNPSAANGTEGANFAETTFTPNSNSTATEEVGTGPVAYWRFDEGTGSTAYDASGKLNTASISGASWANSQECISGSCLKFDGVDDYVNAGTGGTIAFGSAQARTLSLWVKILGTTSEDNRLISHRQALGGAQTGGFEFTMYPTDCAIAYYHTGISGSGSGTATGCYGTWKHVAAVFTGTQAIMYADGVRKNVANFSTEGTNSQPFLLGTCGSQYNDGASNCDFQGYMDEVKVFNYALTDAQIKAEYSTKSTGSGNIKIGTNANSNDTLLNGLRGYWKMDEPSANTCSGGVNDSCDSSNHLLDGPWTGNVARVSGKFGGATSYDGSGDYINFGNAPQLQITTDITISAWVYSTNVSTNDYGSIVTKFTDGGADTKRAYRLNQQISSGTMQFCSGNTGAPAGTVCITSSSQITANTWYHVVGVKSGTEGFIYINGVQVAYSSSMPSTIFNTTASALIGYSGSATAQQYFTGNLDEVRIYNRGLSQTEVVSLYNWTPTPVAYWKLDEKTGTSAIDSSGYANTATLTNSPTWINGKYGSGVSFSGNNQYITIADDSDFDFGDDENLTISLWFKHPTASSQEVILSKFNEAGYKILMESDGDITCGLDYDSTWSPTDSVTSTAATYDDNNWHYISCVKNSATSLSLYIDGVLIGTDSSLTATNTLSNSDPLYIGIDDDGASNDFTGQLDDVKIYNSAKTQKEIVQDMSGGKVGVSQPVGYWKFNEGADNTCVGGSNDVCNSGNSSTNIDGAVSGTAVPATSTSGWTTSGKFGKAMNFDGTNDYVSVGTQSSLDVIGGDFTVSSWVKTAQTGSTKWILQKGSGNLLASDKGYSLYLGTSGTKWTFGVWDGTSGHDITPSTTQGVDTTNWHHLVRVFAASTQTPYLSVDGILASQATNSSYSTPSISANNFNIGATGAAGSSWSGGIDEVKVYSYALSSDEVKLDYNQGANLVLGTEDTGAKITGGAGSAPLAYWDLNEKTGLTAIDKSGTGINGTLEGGAKWTSGKFGSAIYFDGVDDRVNMGDVTTFDSQTGLSVSLWTKISTLATARRLVSKWTAAQSTFMISLDDTNSDELIMAVSDGTHYDVFSTTNADLVANRWYHIEMTWTDTTRAIYVNGVSMALTTTLNQAITGTNNSTEPLQIGDSGETTPFNGFIDEVKIYNYARSQGLVAYDYNHGAPAGLWPLDDCQGTTAVDASPNSNGDFNGHNGTITIGGTGTYTSAGSCNSGTSTEAWNGGTTGKINSALGFDGTNDYVEIAYASTLAPSVSISFGGWFYTTDKTQTSQSILSKTQGGGYNLFLNNTGGACGSTTSLCGLVNVSSSYYAVDYPVSNLSNNTWYHAMVTFNGSIVKLYLNGQLVDSKPASGVVTYTVSNALCIGAEPGNTVCDAGSPFNGKLDDIRVYNYDLSPTQIKEVYNQGSLYFGPSTGTP